MEVRLYYRSWLKIGITQQVMVEVSHIFQQDLWNDLWDTWRGPFMVLCKPGFTVGQHPKNWNCQTIFSQGLQH
jgi:hypothetical protein